MKAINRLNEIQTMKKYSKYLYNELVPSINKTLNLEFAIDPTNVDPYTQRFQTNIDPEGKYTDIKLKFTTNKKDIDGLFWGEFTIFGRKAEIGSITGDLKYDIDIVEDAFYYFYEQAENNHLNIPRF